MVNGISFISTPYPSGEKGENKIEKRKHTEVDATEPYSSSTSNARLTLTSSTTDECSPFTQEHSSYEIPPKTKNNHLERQPCEHDPNDNGAYENFNNIKIETNASGGKGNHSNAIPSDISENDNQGGKSNRSRAIPSDISDNGNQGGKSNRSRAIPSDISENGNQGGKSNRSRAIPSDISENGNQGGKSNRSRAIPSDISENGSQGGKSNRSSAIPSDIGENDNQVGTDSDSDSSYTTARGSFASSTKSGAEEPCYENLAIPKDDDKKNQTREHNPDDNDLYVNSNAIKTVTNVSGGKSNRSGAIPSDISENNNQVGTVSDSNSSYETARESGAEASVTENTTNDQIQASPCIYNIVNVNNVTLNIANK